MTEMPETMTIMSLAWPDPLAQRIQAPNQNLQYCIEGVPASATASAKVLLDEQLQCNNLLGQCSMHNAYKICFGLEVVVNTQHCVVTIC